jgi:outer membrane protein assembly factor BamD (BamD/ComL family)
VAKDKASQLLAEYPNSQYAEKAQKFLEVIEKKL